jgi:hypothetical protein
MSDFLRENVSYSRERREMLELEGDRVERGRLMRQKDTVTE